MQNARVYSFGSIVNYLQAILTMSLCFFFKLNILWQLKFFFLIRNTKCPGLFLVGVNYETHIIVGGPLILFIYEKIGHPVFWSYVDIISCLEITILSLLI